MVQDLFKFLPSEIINDILLRLPIRAIATSKCVCRSWLDFLESDEFVKSHHSRSSECLVVLTPDDDSACNPRTLCSVSEIDSESSGVHRYNRLTSFYFPYIECIGIEGSANGLFFLYNDRHNIVCNPISREYIHLRSPENQFNPEDVIYGFGVSKISGQYKVFRSTDVHECHVYTLGTGSWRRVEAPHHWFSFESIRSGACVNGNLHWLASEDDEDDVTLNTSCFDLETECFSTFNLPAPLDKTAGYVNGFSVLRDCLCVCYSDQYESEMAVWLMKEYGDEKSWTKEYVIDTKPNFYDVEDDYLYPIKVFKDGDMLMICSGDMTMTCSDEHTLYHYSKQKKDISEVRGSTPHWHQYLTRFILVTPSIRSLKSFGMENVISF